MCGPKLPDEIILNVVSRLPVESVLQCKFVCKRWDSLIYHSKDFSRMHSRRVYDDDSVAAVSSGKACFIHLFKSVGKLNLLKHMEYDDENYKRPLKFEIVDLIPPYDCQHIVGSCNGLICISVIFEKNIIDPVYICNPVTKESAFLPTLRVKNLSSKDYVVSGFGYIRSTSEYKVVRIYYAVTRSYWNPHWNEPLVGRVQVYTLGSGYGWRKKEDITHELYPSVSSEIFADGALHWFDKQGNVVAFDLAEEKFQVLPKPKITTEMWNRNILIDSSSKRSLEQAFELRVLGGCLCIIDRASNKNRYPIWSFKKMDIATETTRKRKRVPAQEENNAKQTEHYNSSWSWNDDLSFDWEALNCYKRTRSTHPFAILKNGTKILYHNNGYCYLRQDLGGHHYQHMTNNHIPQKPIRYVKSFVSLKAIGENQATIILPSEGAQELQRSDLDTEDEESGNYRSSSSDTD